MLSYAYCDTYLCVCTVFYVQYAIHVLLTRILLNVLYLHVLLYTYCDTYCCVCTVFHTYYTRVAYTHIVGCFFFNTVRQDSAGNEDTSKCIRSLHRTPGPALHTHIHTDTFSVSLLHPRLRTPTCTHTHTHTHLLLSLPCRRRRYLRGCLPLYLSLSLSISLSLALYLGGGADAFEVGARLQRLGEVQQIGRLCLASKR